MKPQLKALAVGAAAVLALSACSTGGDGAGGDDAAYPNPNKAITLLIPYGAGGGTDLAGRLLASGLEENLGAKVVIENNPAGSGIQAITQLSQAAPDGYTLAFQPLPALNTMYLDEERGAPFTADDFVPIANHDTDVVAFAVGKDSPYQSMEELIAAAKADPGQVTAGSNGVLAAGHLGLLQLEKSADIQLTWSTFDDGGQLRTSVLGGSVDLEVQPVSEFTAAASDGSLRVLAVMSEERLDGFPDVPTLVELGYPDGIMATNRILMGPAGLPQSVIDTLAGAIEKSEQDADYQAEAQKRKLALNYLGPSDVADLFESFDTTIAPLVTAFRANG